MFESSRLCEVGKGATEHTWSDPSNIRNEQWVFLAIWSRPSLKGDIEGPCGTKQMGGYESGLHSNQPKIEDCNSLDANQLNRGGCLKSGWCGKTTWSRNGVKTSSIGMHASNDSLHLGYSSKQPDSLIQHIRIERIPCRFGGTRAYFRCKCNKRVVKLYSVGKHFRCRHC